ncbi:Rho termination factor N-terminal domain-containing protein [candidate division KSB1 bacterium]|nr:Rho termination factor N-terminal domain-containing protein [candidate division KSB1 bacterium]
MDYTFKDLKKKTVAQLREIAATIEHEAVQGYTQLNKEHLVEAICKALNIDMFEHHVAKAANKSKIKAQIRSLKLDRDKFIEARNYAELKNVRKQIKTLKNKLRRAAA